MEGRDKPYVDKYMEILGEQNYDFKSGADGILGTWFMLHRVYIKYKTTDVMFPIKTVCLKNVKLTAVLKFRYLTGSCCNTLCFD